MFMKNKVLVVLFFAVLGGFNGVQASEFSNKGVSASPAIRRIKSEKNQMDRMDRADFGTSKVYLVHVTDEIKISPAQAFRENMTPTLTPSPTGSITPVKTSSLMTDKGIVTSSGLLRVISNQKIS